jgi:S1-C subfamily serine protease
MDHLSKQQIVLLALLVSFMTSLATGIVTVSLMDQAPQGVTHTVSQVIEKTIEQVSPQNAAVGTVTLSVDDQIAAAVAKVSPSIVKIKDARSGNIAWLGLIVSKEGAIMTDKSVVAPFSSYEALFSDGSSVPVNVIQGQANSDAIFLAPAPLAGSSAKTYVSVVIAPDRVLGQSVFSLSGTSTAVLGQGIITETAATSSPIGTSIAAEKISAGSPLFDIKGDVIGMSTGDGASFSLIGPLVSAAPALK